VERDPSRVLPELVMSLNVMLAQPIPRASAARRLEMAVSIKGSKARYSWMVDLHLLSYYAPVSCLTTQTTWLPDYLTT
jgi:hypothetical protein